MNLTPKDLQFVPVKINGSDIKCLVAMEYALDALRMGSPGGFFYLVGEDNVFEVVYTPEGWRERVLKIGH
jgi:hypothetical protein